jgi:hypothetical protein
VAGEKEVVRICGEAGADSDGFLSAAYVDATNDFALPVELFFNSFLDFPREEHVLKESLGQLSVGVRHIRRQPAGPR